MALASMVKKPAPKPAPKPARQTQAVTKVVNAGLFKDKANSARMDRLNSIIDNGGQLNKRQLANYNNLVKRQNKLQFNADTAKNKQAASTYQAVQDSAPARAIGGYLGPQSNYNWNQYAQESGIDPNSTQATYLRGLTPQDYGTATGRSDWSMGQALTAPNPQDFKSQFGYDLGNSLKSYDPGRFQAQTGASVSDALKAYNPQDFQNEFGQNLKDLSTQTGVSDFQKYSGNPNWSLADQLKQFTGQDLENSPGYQFALKQGQQALDRTAAARGGALGGGQLKAQTQYAQDYAGTKFNDYFNQDMANKQLNLGQFNNYTNSDMARKANLLNQYDTQQTNRLAANAQTLGQYNNMANQDLNNRQTALGQYQNWWNNTTNNQNRDLQNFYNLAGYKNTIGQNVLNNYQQNWNNYENQRNTYGNYLMNLAQMGQNAAGGTAGMLTGQNNAMADRFTGAASANAQNNWNGAMATNQAVQGGINNGIQLAGMYGAYNGGFGGGLTNSGKPWTSTGPVSSYNDINGPGMSTVIA